MRTFHVEGDKTFRINVPDDVKVTYGPWAPPNSEGYRDSAANKRGTLRIYQGSKENILACFAGVTSFRDVTNVNYSELVAKEEVAAVWKNDAEGYQREEKINRTQQWQEEPSFALPAGKKKRK